MNSNSMRRSGAIWWASATAGVVLVLGGAGLAAGVRPVPTDANVPYGPHPHQLLDIYLPAGGSHRPVLVWYGLIWEPGKGTPDLRAFRDANCAVVSVETRTMSDAVADKASPPIAYVMDDACRAVQFVRLNTARWDLDPNRIAVAGSSQGALPALYVGCSGDRANPQSADPVLRVSTRVLAVAAHRSQPSIDPKRMQEWVPGVIWGAPALGCGFAESLRRRDELLPILARWSPDELLSKDDPPIYFEYNWGLTRPEGVQEMDYKVHSPAVALGFQKLAHHAGVVCHVKYPGHPTEGYKNFYDFLVRNLTSPKPAAKDERH
jgi:hypothetical protein